jgi:hypothetical protein
MAPRQARTSSSQRILREGKRPLMG